MNGEIKTVACCFKNLGSSISENGAPQEDFKMKLDKGLKTSVAMKMMLKITSVSLGMKRVFEGVVVPMATDE